MRRKKDTGEPGNRGQFSLSPRGSSGIRLGGGPAAPFETFPMEDAASDPRVSVDTLNRMLEHDQPLPVRAAAARSSYPGTAERASYDPDPYVRALAAAASDLSDRTKQRLSGDPQVKRVLAVLTA